MVRCSEITCGSREHLQEEGSGGAICTPHSGALSHFRELVLGERF